MADRINTTIQNYRRIIVLARELNWHFLFVDPWESSRGKVSFQTSCFFLQKYRSYRKDDAGILKKGRIYWDIEVCKLIVSFYFWNLRYFYSQLIVTFPKKFMNKWFSYSVIVRVYFQARPNSFKSPYTSTIRRFSFIMRSIRISPTKNTFHSLN